MKMYSQVERALEKRTIIEGIHHTPNLDIGLSFKPLPIRASIPYRRSAQAITFFVGRVT